MIVTRTPFRISFVGGGTDIPDIITKIGRGFCTGMTINKYMWICANERFDSQIRVSYSRTEITKEVDELQHDIARACLKELEVKNGIEIVSIADIPAGTGLGSSSAYTVGLLNALYHMQGVSPSPGTLAREATHIELEVLGKVMGVQDIYMSAYGGLLSLFITKGMIKVNSIEPRITFERLLRHNTKLLYTGDQHLAHAILKEQVAECNSKQRIDDYKNLAALSEAFARLLQEGIPLDSYAAYINEAWTIKKRLSPSITNLYIDSLCESLYSEGALAVKLCGAGAAGFLLVVFPMTAKEQIESLGLKELPFNFERYGSTVMMVS